jgi:DNA-binding MarR family transcriptional regulator
MPSVTHRLQQSGLASEIEFLTARSRAIGSAITNARLADLGLRVRSYSVLSLAASGARPTQRDLAEFLRLDPSQIVSIIDGLEELGLVTRRSGTSDRRSKVIVATDEGVELAAKARQAARDAEDEALAGLTDVERDQLRALLRKAAFESGAG